MLDIDLTTLQSHSTNNTYQTMFQDSIPQDSNLSIRNAGSSIAELYELHMPYVITFESIHCQQNSGVFLEISPTKTSRISFTLPDPLLNENRPLHQHDFFELMVVLSGTVTQRIEDEYYQYEAGQACLLNRNIRHSEEFSMDFEAVFLMFSDEILRHLFEHHTRFSSGSLHDKHSGSIYQLIEKNQRSKYYFAKDYIDFIPENTFCTSEQTLLSVHSLINQLVEETGNQQPGSLFMAEGLIFRFLALLEDTRLFRQEAHSLSGSNEELLLNKTGRILEERHGLISRKELEHLLNYNGDYVNRIVKKYTGMTLSEYGLAFKLKEALHLLLNSDKSISSITNNLGFSNRSYFYRVFRQRYGMTPKEYREHVVNSFQAQHPILQKSERSLKSHRIP